ncbi:hypothetical protein ACFPM0_34200 [Pseudonocardia sulfidoxydans]
MSGDSRSSDYRHSQGLAHASSPHPLASSPRSFCIDGEEPPECAWAS